MATFAEAQTAFVAAQKEALILTKGLKPTDAEANAKAIMAFKMDEADRAGNNPNARQAALEELTAQIADDNTLRKSPAFKKVQTDFRKAQEEELKLTKGLQPAAATAEATRIMKFKMSAADQSGTNPQAQMDELKSATDAINDNNILRKGPIFQKAQDAFIKAQVAELKLTKPKLNPAEAKAEATRIMKFKMNDADKSGTNPQAQIDALNEAVEAIKGRGTPVTRVDGPQQLLNPNMQLSSLISKPTDPTLDGNGNLTRQGSAGIQSSTEAGKA